MQNQSNKWWVARKDNKPNVSGPKYAALERHKRLICYVLGSLIIFIILHRVWFYVMGTFAVIGAVWVVREYLNKEEKR